MSPHNVGRNIPGTLLPLPTDDHSAVLNDQRMSRQLRLLLEAQFRR